MKKQYIAPSTEALSIAPITTLMAGSGVIATGLKINNGYVNPADAGTGV